MSRRRSAILPVILATLLVACGGGDTTEPSTTAVPSEPGVTTVAPPTTTVPDEPAVSAAADAAMTAIVEDHDIPSAGVAIVIGDEVVWAAGYGDQAALDTVYQIGSIEKVFVATALLQLAEQGLIDLAADVSDYLPFEVRHPDHPEVPITVLMVLTHTSGLGHDLPDNLWFDNDDEFLAFGAENGLWDLNDSPYRAGRPALGQYLQSWLAPDGIHAAEPGTWSSAPGQWGYSNIGIAHLGAFLVEQATGQSFYDYVDDHIFDPLKIADSSTDAADLLPSRIAVPHTRHEGINQELPLTGMRAADRIRMTAGDLATFLAMHMGDGRVGDVQLLSDASAAAIREPQISLTGTDFPALGLRGQGMAWTIWDQDRSGHSGATPGYYGVMMMQESDDGRIGIVILQNVGCSLACDQHWFTAGHTAMRELLLDEAQRIIAERP